MLSSIELCAGAGGQALGLEQAGFGHAALVEIDRHCCETLRANRPEWNVIEDDIKVFKDSAHNFKGIDLLAGGLPCPPFSIAGKQLGEKDERNLFDDALDIIDAARPKAVMIENVKGFLGGAFTGYREHLKLRFEKLGYWVDWKLFNASDFGVPQLRPRVVIAALKYEHLDGFQWPDKDSKVRPKNVGDALFGLMSAKGWEAAKLWKKKANKIAPTIVGGSKKHGGPDLGPTRARAAWAELGVNGKSIAEEAPEKGFEGMPRLTVPMVAKLQGFPENWEFQGRKTHAYKQVGNAFPPPVAKAVAEKLAVAIMAEEPVLLRA